MMNRTHRNTEIGKHNRALMLMALESGPMSTEQLADLTGLGNAQVTRHIGVLRLSSPKLVYISGFLKVRGKGTPVYALGNKPDAKFELGGKASRLEKAAADNAAVIPTTPQTWYAALL